MPEVAAGCSVERPMLRILQPLARAAVYRSTPNTPRAAGTGRRLRGDGRSGHHNTNGCSCDRRPVVAAIPAAPVAATRVALHDKMRGLRSFERHGLTRHFRSGPAVRVEPILGRERVT